MHKVRRQSSRLALGGLMAALVCIATSFFRLPVPITQGYIHLGDAFVLVGAVLLGPVGVVAGALGSLLADLLGGYFVYLLPTFLIKGLMGLVAYAGCRRWKQAWWLALLAAEVVMLLGYFGLEWLLYGLSAAVGALLPNGIQGACGAVFGIVLLPVFRRLLMGMKAG